MITDNLLMDMRKRVTVLLTVCILVTVVVSLELYVMRPVTSTSPLVEDNVSVGEILQNPSAWVNKTVMVEGNLSGFFFGFPEHVFTDYGMRWSYELTSNGSTIGVDHFSLGDFSSAPARVYGVVRERRVDIGSSEPVNGTLTWPSPYPHWISGYYIEAERIELL